MDIRTKIYSALSTIAAMTAIVACSEIDNVANGHYKGDGRITFSASTVAVDEGTMRAAGAKAQNLTSIAAKTDDGKTLYLHTTVTPIPVDSATHTMRGTKTESVASISDFGIKAYKTTNAFATDLTTSGTQHFDNVEASTDDATPTTSSEWNTSTPYYWPDGTAKLSFFAYSPYTSTNPFGTSGGKVTLSYTANATVASQEDLLIAAAFDENHSASLDPKQSLTFKHALTAVTFEAAADLFPCTITKVSLSGIPTTNTYTYATAAGASYGTWGTTGSNVKTFDFPLNVKVTSSTATLTSDTDETTLLMVPQTLPSGAKATIKFTDDAGRSHTLSYSLEGQLWEAGKQVKYTLSSSSLTSIKIDFADAFAQQSGSSAQALPSEIKTKFAASDQIGFYVVDIVNDKVVAANIPITVSSEGTSVTITSLNSSTLAAQAFLSDDANKYRYFAYYPYQSTAPTTMAASAVTTSTTGEQFFASLISGWTPVADQSAASAATINRYDLQVGDVIGTGSGISSKALTIKLRHQMGLAAIAMASSGTSSHVETLTLDGNTTNPKYSSTSTTAYYALDEFSGNLPYKVGTRNTPALRCYFLVNPAKSYTFGTTYKYADADAQRQWNNFTISSSSNTVNAGKYRVITTTTPKFKNLGRLYSYSATGRQDYTPILKDCKYQMECWGASGGKLYGQYETMSTGGRGGYTKGIITLTTARLTSYPTLYVYVGQKGSDWNGPDNPSANCPVAWNGGGTVTIYNACGGGGATDIRLSTGGATATTWNNSTSLASRIMVAGAGGGANDYGFGGAGGGLEGLIGKTSPAKEGSTAGCGTGGTQIKGGTGQVSGGFGYGGTQTNFDGGAGGGGYYGGGQGTANGAGGGGGSSYISGLSGCATHSSGWTFDGAVTYSGTVAVYTASGPTGNNTTIPDPAKNEGNLLAYTKYSVHGYARIILKPYD